MLQKVAEGPSADNEKRPKALFHFLAVDDLINFNQILFALNRQGAEFFE